MESLEAYSEEIGQHEPMTLDDLIVSHRYLRSLNLEFNQQWSKGQQEGYEKGLAQGREQAMAREFLPVERLRTMTITELAALIVEPE